MKTISYILLGVALLLAIVGLILFFDNESQRREQVLKTLKNAREAKEKKRIDNEIIYGLENEINQTENLKPLNEKEDASKKKETD